MRRPFGSLALLASAGCTGEYALPPTPCDEHCLVYQRADCAADMPHECVNECERGRSPDRYPDCRGEFDGLLACLREASDGDFACVNERSEPRAGVCQAETRALDFCVAPVFYRCVELCESRHERCPTLDAAACFRACRSTPPECEEVAVRFLDCEIADQAACDPTLTCTPLQAELSRCVNLSSSAESVPP